MSCTGGSEKRPGAPDSFNITVGDVAAWVGSPRTTTTPYYGIVDIFLTADFCSTGPAASYLPPRYPGDIGTAAFNKVVDNKWAQYCKCKPLGDPSRLSHKGGRCPVKYDVTVVRDSLDYRTFESRRDQDTTRGLAPFTINLVPAKQGNIDSTGVFLTYADVPNSGIRLNIPSVPGTVRWSVSVARVDGLSDDCGNYDAGGVEPPPDYVYQPPMPLPDFPPTPCFCPPQPPGSLFVPEPAPPDTQIRLVPVPVPVPTPVPVPVPVPVPIPIPVPIPVPTPVPPPPPVPRPRKPEDMDDCCDEVLAKLNTVLDNQDKADRRFDGLIECLDFGLDAYDRSFTIAQGQQGTVDLPDRIVAVKFTAIPPTPANRSVRQDGGTTPDVLQGGWAWFEFQGGLTTRQPIDAERKLLFPPDFLRSQSGVRLYWFGANGIRYVVTAVIAKEQARPPYEERPCQ